MTSEGPALTLDERKKRLRYRAWHRGMLEMDMILGPFADAHLPGYALKELERLEQLMEEQDADLLKWIMGREAAPEAVDSALIAELVVFQKSRIGSDG